MKARLPWILLAVSLAFNAFFTAGYIAAKCRMASARTMRGRAERLAKGLDLDEKQRKVFDRLVDDYERLRTARDPQREAFLAELLKDNPDQKVLEEYLVGPGTGEYRLAQLRLMREFTGMLSPQQREKFVERIRKRSPLPK